MGTQVGVGEVLARIPQESSKTRDITGGLPRVVNCLKLARRKDAGMLADLKMVPFPSAKGYQGQATSDHYRSGWCGQ